MNLKPGNKTKKHLVLGLKIIVSAIIVYILVNKLDVKALFNVAKSANLILLMAAMLAFIVSKLLSSIRLTYFLQPANVHLSQAFNLKLYWLGMYYNMFLPGGVGGDGYKVYFLNKKLGANTKKTLMAILLDRVTGLVALCVLCFLLGFFVDLPYKLSYYLLIISPLALGGFYFFIKFVTPDFLSIFLRTNLLSFGVQIAQLLSALLILVALGYTTNFAPYLFLFLVSSVVTVIPFTIGGVGAREITFLVGSEWLNLDPNLAVAISLLFFCITALVSFAGVYYSFAPIEIKSEKYNHQAL